MLAALLLHDGLYQPIRSNNDSVCPQLVRAIHQDDELTALEVTYVGDCYEQGPFEYYCHKPEGKLVCEAQNERFTILDPKRYLWESPAHSIWAELELNSK